MLYKNVLLDNTSHNFGGVMKYSAWDVAEVKKLFLLIEKFKSDGETISEAFKQFASESKRSFGSVRNYYYQELAELENNSKRLGALQIDLNNHRKSIQKNFGQEEEKQLSENIEKLIAKNYSVRRACLELSGGDVNEMLRLQNKYRNIKRKQVMTNANNVLYMPHRGHNLSDKEITSLFLGLVRLVKRSATEEAQRNNFVNQRQNEKAYQQLRGQFEVLKCENEKLTSELQKMKCKEAEVMSKKLRKLKQFAVTRQGSANSR